MKNAIVGIARTAPRPDRAAVAVAVKEVISLAGGLPPAIRKGARVLLKPNLVSVPPTRESGAVTHPEVCRAMAAAVIARGAFPFIADSAGVGVDTGAVIDFMGYDVLRREGIAVLDLKQDRAVTAKNPGGRVLPLLHTFDAVLEADAVINLPVLKTHDQVEITLGLKNLKGLLQDRAKKAAHRCGVVEAVIETAAFFKPCFTLVDGIFGQEGVGPVYGEPVEMDLLIAGADPVAVDAVAGEIIGFAPQEVPITRRAAEAGLGTADSGRITVTGLQVDEVRRPFKRCSEAEILKGALPCNLLFAPETCTGCRNTVISVLVAMDRCGLLHHFKGLTVVAGPVRGELPPGEPFLVGNCARKTDRKALHIEGCPPENSWIIEALVKR